MKEESLPRGWIWTKLGEVLPISYGKALGGKDRSNEGNVPVFGSSGNVGTHNIALTKSSGLIIGRKGNVGSVYFSEKAFWPIDTVYFTEGFDGLDLKFFYYLLSSLHLKDLDRSTAVPGLSRNDYSDLKVSIPPSEEQKRIATQLDTLFSELDAGLAAIARARAKVKGFRASLLRAATSGELSARWRANDPPLESGAALLGRVLDERRAAWEAKERAKRAAKSPAKKLFEDESWKANYLAPKAPDTANLPQLPQSWCWASVAQLGDVKGGKRLPLGHTYAEEKTIFPYLRVVDFEDGTINTSKLRFLSARTQEEIKNYIITSDDLFISIAGTIGEVGIIPESLNGANLTENAAKVCNLHLVSPHYLRIIFSSQLLKEQISKNTLSTTQPKLALFRILGFHLPLPPLAEQEWIVAEVERRLSLVSEVERTLDAAEKRAQSLRAAILARAFRGELCEQNPGDESAESLLQRIREAREAAPKRGKRASGQGRLL